MCCSIMETIITILISICVCLMNQIQKLIDDDKMYYFWNMSGNTNRKRMVILENTYSTGMHSKWDERTNHGTIWFVTQIR